MRLDFDFVNNILLTIETDNKVTEEWNTLDLRVSTNSPTLLTTLTVIWATLMVQK